MPPKSERRDDKFTWDLDIPMLPIAACSLCELTLVAADLQ